MIGGHFSFLRVKLQCMDLDSLIFSPHFLYHFSRRERCSWMFKEAVIGSILLVIISLSSAKSPTRDVGIVSWLDMKMLNKRGAVTAP
jgi:hypothetical protein